MKKYYMLLAGTMLLAVVQTKAQTKVGGAGAPDGSAMLEVTGGAANNKGLLMPRLTTTQRNAITSPATGLMIYNTTTNQAQVNTGTPVAPIWAIATTTTTGWNTTGNTGTTPATNFIGTADSQAVVIRTNNTEKVRVTPSGNVGIGIATPGVKLQVRDTGDVTMLIGTPVGNRGHISLGNMNHGLIRGLEGSGGEGNDIALYTTAGNAVGASLYLVSDPSVSNDSLPLNQFVLKQTGNIGMGTNAPTSRLHVNDGNLTITNNGPIASSAINVISDNGGGLNPDDINITSYGSSNALFGFSAARGTAVAPLNSQTGDSIGGISFGARVNGTFAIASGINATYSGDSTNLNSRLSFATSGQTQMMIADNGNVGIGTTAPGVKLQVRDTGDVTVLIGTPNGNRGRIALGNGNHGLVRNLASSGGEANDIALYTTAGNAVGASLYLVSDPSSSNDSLPLNQFVLKSTGNVGIGTNAPTARLSVNGTTNNLSGTWGIFSDARVKTIDADYKDGLTTVMKIHPVKFHYNANAPFKSGEQQIGIIAQEMEQIAPYMVTKVKADGFDDLRQYNAQALPYMLVNAIQEQQAQIEALKAKNEQLEAANKATAQLMERVKQMEQMMGINEIEGTSKVAGK